MPTRIVGMKRFRPAFSRLETRLEHLIEGTFTQLFGRSLHPHDLSVQLSRAVETGLRQAEDGDSRPIAPDRFTIVLNDRVQRSLISDYPELLNILRQHIVDIAAFAGYRLVHPPLVQLQADPTKSLGEFVVLTEQSSPRLSTSALQAVRLEPAVETPVSRTYLLINGDRTEILSQPLITIGRASSNDITIDDPHMSRHHAQLRLRATSYLVFDVNSQSGVRVNDVPIREYLLHNGDVMQMGRTRMVFLQDRPEDLHPTSAIDPIDG